MTIAHYVRTGGVVFSLSSAIFFGFQLGQHYEGNARCLKDGIEEHFARDFPGYNPDADGNDSIDQKLDELRMVYMSGELLDYAEHLNAAEQVDAIQKSRVAKRKVEGSCEKDNRAY